MWIRTKLPEYMNLMCMSERLKLDWQKLGLKKSGSKSRQWPEHGVTCYVSYLNRYWSIIVERSIAKYLCTFSNITRTILEGRSLNNGRQIIKEYLWLLWRQTTQLTATQTIQCGDGKG